MRFIWIICSLFISGAAFAFCPFSERLQKTLKEESIVALYKNCAEVMNDDGAQAKLAAIYDKGTPAIPRDLKKALLYYQLSADNGNAASQARLAQLYMELDKNREGRADLYGYLQSILPVSVTDSEGQVQNPNGFRGELVHPYVLLMLANEKAENKWYYPTKELQAPPFAKVLFNSYQVDAKKKKTLLQQASQWKKRKLLEIAEQILTKDEYRNFVETLYPANGQPDKFKRSQLLQQFQDKVKKYKEEDLASAKAFY